MHCCRKKRADGGGHRRRCRALMFGALVGLGIGLLLAPRPGSETMAALKDKLIRKLPV